MIPDDVLQRAVRQIQHVPELAGCMVALQGNGACRILAYPSCVTPYSENVAVVIEEVTTNDKGLTAQLARLAKSGEGAPRGAPGALVATNRSKLGPELIGAGVSCGLTIVSAVGLAASVAAEVPTAGAASFLVVASWLGLGSGAIQCANGVVRIGAMMVDPDADTLERWDANRKYAHAILIVDAVGIASGIGALPFAVRNLWAVIARQRAFTATGLSFERLRSMNRVERLRVISDAFEDATRTPEGRVALLQAAREAHLGVRTLQRTSGLSVNHADTLRRIISDETARRISASLRDTVSGVLGVAASATPAEMTGSASGSVNWVINLLDAGAPNL